MHDKLQHKHRKTSLTCIVCPRGCTITARFAADEAGTVQIHSLEGAACRRGEAWARQEIICPLRILCSSVRVIGGRDPLASVKTDRPIPLGNFPDVMKVIQRAAVEAPVHIGDAVITDPAGTACTILVTRPVSAG